MSGARGVGVGAALATLLVVAAITWPLPVEIGRAWSPSAFGASHAWVAEHLWTQFPGSPTDAAGFPWTRRGRFIDLVPTLATWAARPLLGPIGGHEVVQLASLPLTAAVTAWFVERRLGADRWTSAASGFALATSPFLLSTLKNGETPNLQAWMFPLFLAALADASRGSRRAAVGLAALTLATAATSPYFAMLLPFLAVGALLAERPARREVVAVLLALAAGLAPAYAYYADSPPLRANLFRPAMPADVSSLVATRSAATVHELLFGHEAMTDPRNTNHLAWLGILAFAVPLVALVRRRPPPGVALGLVAGGALLALGPRMTLWEGGPSLPGPDALLARVPPFHHVDGWFRFSVIAALGLAIGLADVCRGLRYGRALATGLAIASMIGAIAEVGRLPVEPIRAQGLLAGLPRGDDGAVVLLPVQSDLQDGQDRLLMALVHGRPTDGLPRPLAGIEARASEELWRADLAATDPADALREDGVRVVLWDVRRPTPPGLSPADLPGFVGEEDGIRAYDLGPARPQKRLISEIAGGAAR